VLDLLGKELSEAGTAGDEPVFAELSAPYREQAPSHIDIAQAQAACLAGAQPEPVAQGEDRPVGLPPAPSPGVVAQGRRRLQQPACLGQVEDVGQPVCRPPARPGTQRRDRQQVLDDGPVEEDP
jgi:hypothetical protein